MVFHFAPYPPESGVVRRMFHTFKECTKRNEVSVLAFGTESDEQLFRKHFGAVCQHIVFIEKPSSRVISALLRIWFLVTLRPSWHRWQTRPFQRALDALVRKERFDVVHFSSSVLGFYQLPKGVPLVADTHNVEYELLYRTYKESKDIFRKMYNGIEYLLTKREEIASSKKFDVVLATSENDLRTFRRDLPNQKMYVIPNGVDIEFFSSQTAEPEPNSIVFTGLMSYFPNDHGIQFFLKEIFPFVLSKVPDVTVTIVGADPSREVLRLASNNVRVTGYVGDVRPYFDKALVAIVPLLVGGGTRLKVLEAMAMRKPVVSTTLGCEGLDVQHGHSVLLADTPQEYADAIVELFLNEKLRHKLQQNAYEIVESTYDWKTIGTQLQRVFEELNADKPRTAVEIQQLVSQ